MANYERLSAMDASFLGIEDQAAHMHVGAVMLFDAAPLRLPDGGIDIDRIRRAVHARLHLVPRFRQRVAYVPWEGLPVWIDDDRFPLISKTHHCMVDGVSGADLMAVLLDAVPDGEVGTPEPWTARRRPSGTRLVLDAALR